MLLFEQSPDECLICGAPNCTCKGEKGVDDLVALVQWPRRSEEPVSEYRSKEQVWSKEDERGAKTLLYAEGDPIPEEEARRQGLVGRKSKAKPDDKAVDKEQAEDKDGKTPARRRRSTKGSS